MNERDPFDGPSPVGALGEAMAGLTEDAPEAEFDARTIRRRYDEDRSHRRQVWGGLAAGVAAIAALGLIGVGLVSGGSNSASTATSASSSAAMSSSAGSAGVPAAAPAAGSSSAASAAASSSSSSASSSSAASAAAGTSSGSSIEDGAAPAAPSDASDTLASCRPAPFSDAQLAAVANAVAGLSRQDSCVIDATDLQVQRFTVANGTLVTEVRAGASDPCPAGVACADVPGHPGVRSVDLPTSTGSQTQVWLTGPDRTVVLTVDPTGTVPVADLATAAEALVAAG